MAIDKVVLEGENQTGKNLFDMGHDLNTTYSWGEMQVTNCQLVPVPAHNRFSINSLVRCFPLVSPTFGRVVYKQFHHFISFTDIFPKWKQILSNQQSMMYLDDSNIGTNRGRWTTEVVSHLPMISSRALLYCLLNKRSYSVFYSRQATATPAASDLDNTSSPFKPNFSRSWTSMRSDLFGSNVDTNLPDPRIYAIPSNTDGMYFLPKDSDFKAFGKYELSGVTLNFISTWKLNPAGRRILKLLRGLGYYLSFRDDGGRMPMSLLPLIAFYRAYWCSFGIPQYVSWESTACYALIEHLSHIVQNTSGIDSRYINTQTFTSNDTSRYLLAFFDELEECFYVDNKQLESIAIDPSSVNQNKNFSNPFANFEYFRNLSASEFTSLTANSNILASFDSVTKTDFSQIDDSMLQALYVYLNKSSQLGGNVAAALKNRGYTDFIEKCGTHFLGCTNNTVEISEVTMNGDSESRVLGSPAGRGVGFKKDDYITFDNHEPGYFISMGCVVPIVKTTQTMDLTLLGTKFDTFYSPLLDSVGYSAMPYIGVGMIEDIEHLESDDSLVPYGAFGLYPRFTDYKTRKNVLNGAFASPRDLSSMSSYSLDRLLIRYPFNPTYSSGDTNGQFRCRDVSGAQKSSVSYNGNYPLLDYSIPHAGLSWKKTLISSFYGNLDRIFNQLAEINVVDANFNDMEVFGSYRDTFIVHHVIDYKMNACMLPLEMSWQTMDENGHPKSKQSIEVK